MAETTKWIECAPSNLIYTGTVGPGSKDRRLTDNTLTYYWGGEDSQVVITPDSRVRLIYKLTDGDTPEKMFGPNEPLGRFITVAGNNRSQAMRLNGPVEWFFLLVEVPA